MSAKHKNKRLSRHVTNPKRKTSPNQSERQSPSLITKRTTITLHQPQRLCRVMDGRRVDGDDGDGVEVESMGDEAPSMCVWVEVADLEKERQKLDFASLRRCRRLQSWRGGRDGWKKRMERDGRGEEDGWGCRGDGERREVDGYQSGCEPDGKERKQLHAALDHGGTSHRYRKKWRPHSAGSGASPR
ncbi:hypothetical protein B0T21DRAFT_394544 [Apiosordaria backusii]|uniref:Uncharacterized protein n=1 Tax=Apiosordaria backusii TaxID=314023 RepID=A0AA40EBD2_9PEZI|nr:hypothetical protein B0T21DRAFT_394544 [Apiosordaria backusii]